MYVDGQNPNILMFMYADNIASGTDTVSPMQKIIKVWSTVKIRGTKMH